MLGHFDPELPIVVTTDASQYAIEAGMEQIESNINRSVALSSTTLHAAEQRYSAPVRELLDVEETLRDWRAYLYGQNAQCARIAFP